MYYIREIIPKDIEAILSFCDLHIGRNYFTRKKAEEIIKASSKGTIIVSYALIKKNSVDEEILGLRISYPPGQWPERHPSQKLHPELWGVPIESAAYFQSLFIANECQGQGWGKKLSLKSMDSLKKLGARVIVCHSWNESPNNSSRHYLDSLGFKPVIDLPNYWGAIDYDCTRCGKPCLCSATEMVYHL